MELVTLDIILLALFIPALVRGVMKGFVEQIIAMAAIILGAFLAFKFSSALAVSLQPSFNLDGNLLHAICFAIILLLAVLVLNLVGRLVVKILKFASLGWINRILGLVFAIFKAGLVIGLAIMVFESFNANWNIVKGETLDASVVYGALKGFAMKVFPYLKSLISNV